MQVEEESPKQHVEIARAPAKEMRPAGRAPGARIDLKTEGPLP